MLAANPRTAGRCIYCAFRSRQLALQARRHRSTTTTTNTHPDSTTRHFKPSHNATRHDEPLHDATRHFQPSYNATRHFKPAHDGATPQFTYYTHGDRSSDLDASQHGYIGNAGEHSVVRKFAKSDLEQWGLTGKRKGGEAVREKYQRGAVRDNYHDVLHKRIAELKDELSEAPMLEQLKKEKQDVGERAQSFEKVWKSFTRKLVATDGEEVGAAWKGKGSDDASKTVRSDMSEAYKTKGVRGLDERIKYAFYGHVTGSRFTESDIRNQMALADLRYPTEWYPATRTIHRTIHLHVGPTNSGKTYQALQRLETAERGVYAGPLRLLAHEVYTRMNAKGIACSLVTGEERRSAEGKSSQAGNPDMSACTVEMMPLNKTLDVAVIDEIQMIGSPDRGWAWTQALLGVKAKEVHLCGEERTVPLIRELCASVGEKLEVHRYERLSPLEVAGDGSLNGDLRRLRKGDCIVSFSVMGIHALRRQIERQTGRKVATVYGSLPPETRAQQARLFNDPHNDYDFLVASDAVGMGLNLAIKRMIFEASSKFDGVQRRTLGVADIKQIGGRAGRYRTAEQANQEAVSTPDLAAAKGDSPAAVGGADGKIAASTATENVGIVTTLEKFDFPIVAAAMQAEPEPIRTAGLYPPASVLERFASYFPPATPFSYILTRLHELSQIHSQRFHLCGLKEQLYIADLIEPVTGLTIADRNVMCSAPCSRNDEMWRTLMPAYARCIAEQTGGGIVEIAALPLEVLEQEVSASREYLRALETLHKGITTYLWLSYRFAGIFTTRGLAFHVKGLVEAKIEDVLGRFSFSDQQRRKVVVARQKQLLRDMAPPEVAVDGEVDDGEGLAGGVVGGGPEEDGRAAASGHLAGEESGEESDRVPGEGEAADGLEPEQQQQQQQHASLSAGGGGGGRFSGEEDFAFEEPELVDVETPEIPEEEGVGLASGSGRFAQWREQQTQQEEEEEEGRQGSPDSRDVHPRASSEAFGHGGEEEAATIASSHSDGVGMEGVGAEARPAIAADAEADIAASPALDERGNSG
ncbi:hypothetical protein LTR36_009172 [Oleoguttula mirabilis]|uniref:RNA helicase n=1 Tax=Oleoguttula mirabilis TaxID=1507867 RepID=A0AAV9J6A6_9PEZI|nr:hypothetical protein LTR36_009172 [Oleoguttula mirabilis]